MKLNVKELSIAGIFLVLLVALAGCTYAFILQPMANGDKPDLPDLNIGGNTDNDNNDPVVNDGETFRGSLKINFQFFDHINDDAVDTANATVKVYHADKSSLFGSTSTGASITSQVLASDNGKLWLQLTPAATRYIDAAETAASEFLGAAQYYSVDGVLVYMFPIDVSSLEQVSGITTELTLNVYQMTADVTGIDYVSLSNFTSADLSGTARVASSASGYITAMTQETAFKIVKVELSMPDAANITMYDNSQIKNLKVVLGMGNGQPNLVLTGPAHNTGSSYLQFNLGVTDPTQEVYGKPVIYGTTDSATDIAYKVSADCSGFTASAAWVPTLTITYIGPDGATGTFSQDISFTDT